MDSIAIQSCGSNRASLTFNRVDSVVFCPHLRVTELFELNYFRLSITNYPSLYMFSLFSCPEKEEGRSKEEEGCTEEEEG